MTRLSPWYNTIIWLQQILAKFLFFSLDNFLIISSLFLLVLKIMKKNGWLKKGRLKLDF